MKQFRHRSCRFQRESSGKAAGYRLGRQPCLSTCQVAFSAALPFGLQGADPFRALTPAATDGTGTDTILPTL